MAGERSRNVADATWVGVDPRDPGLHQAALAGPRLRARPT